MRTIGVLFRPDIGDQSEIVSRLGRAVGDGREIVVLATSSSERDQALPCKVVDAVAFREAADLVLSFGGDGTLIYASSLFGDRSVPILGINLGHLGFLADADLSELEDVVRRALAGELPVVPRMRLDVRVERDGETVASWRALNEATLRPMGESRLSSFRLEVDGRLMTSLRADGVLVTTPTGSTAYNLAAGGPIVMPGLEALVVTPVCPHQLTQRPVVLPADAKIRILVQGGQSVHASCDGDAGIEAAPGDVVLVEKAPVAAHILTLPERSFFETLRGKLRWGEE